MARKKRREYKDYLELGLHLHSARAALSAAIEKSSEMFTKKQTAKVLRAAQELDKARCVLDAEYCRDACSYDVPPGMPHFPIYMRNWLERHPVERLRLECRLAERRGRVGANAPLCLYQGRRREVWSYRYEGL